MKVSHVMNDIMTTLHFKKSKQPPDQQPEDQPTEDQPTEDQLKEDKKNDQPILKLDKKDLHEDGRKKLTFRQKRRLKLNLTKKCKNSPFLSVQKFLKEETNDNTDVNAAHDLWDKYRKQSKYTLIIERHNIDFHLFLELYSQIMTTREHMESPSYSMPRKFLRPSEAEMEYLIL